MIDLSYDCIVTLQNEVLKKFGVDHIQPNQCKHLAQSVLKQTGKLVSETTLKRVFGLAATQHSFSRYTLNTLAQYCRYRDWEEFQQQCQQKHPRTQSANQSKWSDIKKKATAVSQYTLLALKNRSGIPYNNTVPRQYCLSHVERFLESDYAATLLIAPAGWGKSLAVAHAAEHNWFGAHALHPEDICWFINAHAAGSLLLKGFSLSSWLDNQLSLGNGENFREYFSTHPNERGGRLVLIIDGFDEITMGADKLKMLYGKLEDFVYSNDQHPWVKVILSIRSATWAEVFQQSLQLPSFRKYWYLGPEMDEDTNTNIPLLTEHEVRTVLQNFNFESNAIRGLSDSFVQKLRHPYYLQLFCQFSQQPGHSFVDEHLSLFEIISRFIQQRVFNSPSNTFKIRIIEKMLQLLDMGKNGLRTDKSALLKQNPELFPAYKELITDNILVEENYSQEIMFNVKVRFAHNFLLEYFTAMHFIERNGNQVIAPLLKQIQEYFPQSPFRMSVLKWVLRFAITSNNAEGIQQILMMPLATIEKAHLLEYVVLHYQQADKQDMLQQIFHHGYFRKNSISTFMNDDFIHFKKRKVFCTLLNLVESIEDKLKIRCHLYLIAIMQLDAEQCEIELAAIKKLCAADATLHDMWITPYEAILFHYEYLKFGILNEAMRDKIYHFAQHWSIPSRRPFTVGEDMVYRCVMFCFLLLGDDLQMIQFSERLFREHHSICSHRTDPFRLLTLCWKAQAHLGLNQMDAAKRISSHVEKILRHYSTDFFNGSHLDTLQKFIAAEIWYREKEFNKAIRSAEAAMEQAQRLDFKLFALLNYSVLNRIYQHLQMDKQQRETQAKMVLIRQSTSFKQLLPDIM